MKSVSLIVLILLSVTFGKFEYCLLFLIHILAQIAAYSVHFRAAFTSSEPRIVGGKPITIDRFPWHLSLRFKNEHRCSASLITANRALSTAHCLREHDNLTDFTIMAGSTTRHPDGSSSIVGIQQFLRHPKFDNVTLENDIAVLWLSYKLTLGTKINLIKVNIPSLYGRNFSKLNHFIILL